MHVTLPIVFDQIVRIQYSTGLSEETNTFPGTAGLVPCAFVNGKIESTEIAHLV